MGRRRLRARFAALALATVWLAAPAATLAATGEATSLRADLEGKPIALSQVGHWYCQDFAPPAIHCFKTSVALESDPMTMAAAASVNYVIVYEFPSFAGAYMYISQDYSVLATIGWNDRISSFRGLNSQGGVFFVDWFYSGSSWNFCCNTQTTFLGTYDDAFSSVHHV